MPKTPRTFIFIPEFSGLGHRCKRVLHLENKRAI